MGVKNIRNLKKPLRAMAELESKIERDFVKIAMQKYNCIAFKFKMEGIKGGADRLIFTPSGHSFFLSLKDQINTET